MLVLDEGVAPLVVQGRRTGRRRRPARPAGRPRRPVRRRPRAPGRRSPPWRAGGRSPARSGRRRIVRSARCTSRSLGHVQRRRRLVEDQHGRVGEERAGERDELPLPGGEPPAAPVDVGVVPLGQCGDEVVRADRSRGGDSTSASAGVRAGRTGCSRRPCRRRGSSPGSPCTTARRRSASDTSRRSTPSSSTVPRDRVVEAGDQLGDRRLAGAGRADQRHGLPGRDRQVSAARTGGAVPVAEGHRAEVDRRARARARQRRRCRAGSGTRRALVEHAGRASPARRWPTGASCRTGSAPASARRTGAGRAGTRRARRPRSARRAPGSRRTSGTTAIVTLPISLIAGRVRGDQPERRAGWPGGSRR